MFFVERLFLPMVKFRTPEQSLQDVSVEKDGVGGSCKY